MNYYISDNSPKRAGWIATIVYVVVLVLLLLWVKFDRLDPIKLHYGEIEVVFEEEVIQQGGASTEGEAGAANNETPAPSALINNVPPVATQTTQPAVEVPVSGTSRQPTETPATTTPTEPERVVNQNALFSSNSSISGSGTSTTSTASGSGGGAQGGGYEDVDTFSLEGRSPVGGLVKPSYERQQAGRLVVQISVDASGSVISARIAEGNITNTTLRNAALAAARSTKFSRSNNAVQTGTITYIFRLR